MTIEISEDQEQRLKDAFRSLIAIVNCDLEDNYSTCSCFHIKPFNTHWDAETVENVKKNVQLYLNSWVIPQLSEILGLDEKDVIQTMLMNWHKSEARKIEHNLKNK